MGYGAAAKWIAGVGLCVVALAACGSTQQGSAEAENTVQDSAQNTGQDAGNDAADAAGDGAEQQTGQSQDAHQSAAPSADAQIPTGAQVPTDEPSAQIPTGAQVPTDEPSAQIPTGEPSAPQVPSEQPNAPEGACLAADVELTLGQIGGAAGSVYVPLVFTNTSLGPCSLQGFPGVSYVTNNDGTQLGGSAAWDGKAGPTVTLKPGEKASALVREVNVGVLDPADCDPTPADGLRVYLPGDKHSLYVEQDGARGCSVDPLPRGQSQLSVQGIVAGLPQ